MQRIGENKPDSINPSDSGAASGESDMCEGLLPSIVNNRINLNLYWRCTSWTETLYDMLNYTCDEAAGKLHFYDMFNSSMEFIRVWRTVCGDGMFCGDVRLKSRNGTSVPVWLAVVGVLDSSGECVNYEVTILEQGDIQKIHRVLAAYENGTL